MSNIYIQEPPTNGKVLLVTSVGDVDVELWSKEAPKACRNFVQLCLEDYYDGTIFHRLVHDFIVQGGDPTGTGHGGESVYGKPFSDEFHSRLRFVRRGLVAMANAGAHDNGSQFFFTLAAAPELNNKHTIFGKVGGNTLYNMLKLGEGETDVNEKPRYPHKIIKTKVISNPFDDIVPRVRKSKTSDGDAESKKFDKKGTKNFQLLSFGDEAEEDEREVTEVAPGVRTKGKSSHDLLNDNTLSSVPAVDTDDEDEPNYTAQSRSAEDAGAVAESVRKKLKTGREKIDRVQHQLNVTEDSGTTTAAESDDRLAKLKAETKRLKKDLLSSRSQTNKDQSSLNSASEAADNASTSTAKREVDAYLAERNKYKQRSEQKVKKGSEREAETLKMLATFQSKMERSRKLAAYVSAGVADDVDEDEDGDEKEADNDDDDDTNDLSWTHQGLQFESNERKVLDANVHDIDRYEIFDPRNPLTVRRREESKRAMQQKR